MKKTLIAITTITTTFMANAQNSIGESSVSQKEIFEVTASLILTAIIMFTFLVIIKRYMDFRLKNKIIDKGISETAITSLLQINPNDTKNNNFKWFLILIGIGTALTIIYNTLPIGIHSLAIMAFSIAASFLAYYFFLSKSEK